MRILVINNHSYLPQFTGGIESSTHELVQCLLASDHQVAVMAKIKKRGLLYIENRVRSKLTGVKFPADTLLGYKCYRGWGADAGIANGIKEVFNDFNPDISLIQGDYSLPIADESIRNGVPAIVWLRDASFNNLGGRPENTNQVSFLANSKFIASAFHKAFHINPDIIRPLVIKDKYQLSTTREAVLFINPNIKKGLEIAINLAKMRPDIKFIFQESWEISKADRRSLLSRLKMVPNVEFLTPCQDMQQVYGRAKIVIVPSLLDEAWGRVVTEAHLSGIPVVCSDKGGLPEALADGGVVVSHTAAMREWNDALSNLWDDPVEYQKRVELALRASHRPEIQPSYLMESLELAMSRRLNHQVVGPEKLLQSA